MFRFMKGVGGWRTSALIGAFTLTWTFGALAADAATVIKDADLDGVADRLDLCPATPAGAQVISHGCTALDIALEPQVLVEAAIGKLEEQGASLSRMAAYADAARGLEEGAAALSLAAAGMRRGEVCEAADLAERAVGELDAVRREISGIAVTHATAAVGRGGEEAEVGIAVLPSLISNLSLDMAAQAAPFFRAVCDEQVGRFRARGTVTEVRDFERKFRIGKGPLIGLAEGYYTVGPVEGMDIEVSGIRFADGSRLATTVRGKAPEEAFLKTQQCLELKIARFQKFPPYGSTEGPWDKYRLEGYANSLGILDLERLQRFVAVDNNCPGSTNTFTTVSYSMKIDVTQGSNTWTIATNLEDGDVPVDLPQAWINNSGGQVSATVQKTTCTILGGCNTITLGTHTVGIWVRPTGSYATLNYDKTVFTIDGVYGRAKVTGLDLSVITALAPTVTMFGRGYQAPLNQLPDQFVDMLNTNQPFAIFLYDSAYDDEMYDEEQLGIFELAEFKRTGVDRPSGLVWPEARGTRNGHSFSYSAKVPTVLRDLVTDCSGSLDSHYRMPFHGTDFGLITVTKGNFDDPVSGHSGTAKYALDFSGPSGHWVYAARPGVVFSIDMNNSTNASEPAANVIGNHIVVRHQDYTYGLYYHLAQNSAPSGVEWSKRVFRDTHIANFGSGKLHFEVGNQCHPIACTTVSGYDSMKVLYNSWVATPISNFPFWTSTEKTCYVPRVNDHF